MPRFVDSFARTKFDPLEGPFKLPSLSSSEVKLLSIHVQKMKSFRSDMSVM